MRAHALLPPLPPLPPAHTLCARARRAGLFLLLPHVAKRRANEKYADWDSKGKKEDCADVVADGLTPAELDDAVAQTAFVFQVDIFQHATEPDKSDDCTPHKELQCEYPKPEFYAENAAAANGSACAAAYAAERNRLADLLQFDRGATAPPSPLPAEVQGALGYLVQVFVAEMLLLDEGFAMESEFWVFPPAADAAATRGLQFVLYDHDDLSWRTLDPRATKLEIVTHWQSIGDVVVRTLPLWVSLARDASFLARLRADGPGHADTMLASARALLQTRRDELAGDPAWARNNERWPGFGRLVRPRADNEYLLAYHSDSVRTKPTMAAELDYQESWFEKRAATLKEEFNATAIEVQTFVDKSSLRTMLGSRLGYVIALSVVFLGLLVANGVWACRAGEGVGDFEPL